MAIGKKPSFFEKQKIKGRNKRFFKDTEEMKTAFDERKPIWDQCDEVGKQAILSDDDYTRHSNEWLKVAVKYFGAAHIIALLKKIFGEAVIKGLINGD